MAEPFALPHLDSTGASTAIPALHEVNLQTGNLSGQFSSMALREGPDYVDDWMEKNLAPDLVDFVRNHCTSFARWDLLRRLHGDRLGASLESLASAIGATPATTAEELKPLLSARVVTQRRRQGNPIYRIAPQSPIGEALRSAVRAYDTDREFRFALVYSIVRASHKGTVVE